ncbi:MAG: class I mannose-6-phosphate isomerase [Bacteroidales bacterium]|nr:class I mannose-6-phosphate isomerase [Bacteroidales bacterium]
MNQLYPLKFKPIIKDKIWGGTRLKNLLHKNCKTDKAGESWEISGFPGSVSKVKNGFLAGNSLEELLEVYMGDLAGDGVFEKFGTLFPLLTKFIDANDALSVQVHPDDELGRRLFGSYGKTEMWYIVEAEKDAEIITGFNQQISPEKYLQHLNDKTLLTILNKETAVAGDVFFLPAGRIHAIGKGILLAEIQQTSDATLRIYDYDRLDEKGRSRELHTDKALEAIDFKTYPTYKTEYLKNPDQSNNLARCEYFTVNYLELNKPVEKDYIALDSFVIYLCIEGSFTIQYHHNGKEKMVKGETVLLPAELKNVSLIPDTTAKILEIYIEGLAQKNKSEELLDRLF